MYTQIIKRSLKTNDFIEIEKDTYQKRYSNSTGEERILTFTLTEDNLSFSSCPNGIHSENKSFKRLIYESSEKLVKAHAEAFNKKNSDEMARHGDDLYEIDQVYDEYLDTIDSMRG